MLFFAFFQAIFYAKANAAFCIYYIGLRVFLLYRFYKVFFKILHEQKGGGISPTALTIGSYSSSPVSGALMDAIFSSGDSNISAASSSPNSP